AKARAVWEHAFAGATPTQSLFFADSPTGFTVAGPEAATDRLKLEFNLDIAMGDNVDIFAGYGARISTSGHAHSANIGIRASF
ncbi:MAG: autotransporter domain-containing protein, partial [Rhizobiaceae bacterium]|nr:autotransporter domain-containing protein [Rhizobiaceae bacterium]